MTASEKVCKERDWQELKLLWENVRGKVFVICSWLVSTARVTTKEQADGLTALPYIERESQ